MFRGFLSNINKVTLSGDAWNLEIVYRKIKETDIEKVLPIYMDYYNGRESGVWTDRTVYKRIHQVWSREDSYCMIFVCNKAIIGFAMGYFEQYDDLVAYDLVEIVIAGEYQNKGILSIQTRLSIGI